MENTFNFNRFMMLIRRQWISLGKIYLMAWGVLAGLLLFFFYAYYLRSVESASNLITADNILNFRYPLFVILGLAYMTIISGTYFSHLGQKPKAIFELLLPASRLEKFLTAVFYTAIVASVSYFLIFYLVDAAFLSYIRSLFFTETVTIHNQNGVDTIVDRLVYFYNTDFPTEAYYFLFIPYLLSAIFLLGSIYFRNFQYIKTAICLFIYILVFIFCMYKVSTTLFDGTIALNHHSFWGNKETLLAIFLITGILLTSYFWGVTYMRLKEKEV